MRDKMHKLCPRQVYYHETNNGIEIAIRLTPKASHNKIQGIYEDAEGNTWLKISVTAVPEDGKANQALIDFLAKYCRVPKSTIKLISGQTFRNKILFIEGINGSVFTEDKS